MAGREAFPDHTRPRRTGCSVVDSGLGLTNAYLRTPASVPPGATPLTSRLAPVGWWPPIFRPQSFQLCWHSRGSNIRSFAQARTWAQASGRCSQPSSCRSSFRESWRAFCSYSSLPSAHRWRCSLREADHEEPSRLQDECGQRVGGTMNDKDPEQGTRHRRG